MEKKESTKLNNLLCQLVQDTRDDVRPLIFEDMLEITELFEDHLNTQPQAEEETKLVMPPSAYEQAEKEGFDMSNKVKSELLPEDAPEEKEEWEEELGKLMSTWGKVLLVNKGRIGAGMQTAMYLKFYHFIKDLLLEREVFTKDELFMLKLATNDIHNKGNGAYDEIGEKIERMLSKLTTK